MSELFYLYVFIAMIPIGCAIALGAPLLWDWLCEEVDWIIHRKEYERRIDEAIDNMVLPDISKLKADYITTDKLQASYITADQLTKDLFEGRIKEDEQSRFNGETDEGSRD